MHLKIDWYAGTKDYSTDPLIWFGEALPDWRAARGRQGYLRRLQEMYTGAEFLYHPERQIMGSHLDLSGSAIDLLLSCHPYLDPLDCFLKAGVTAYKPTRIDIAIDLEDGGLFAREYYNQMVKAPERVGRRKVTLYHSIGRGGGKTVYVGSRTSPLFLRIYDKDAQSLGAVPVTRVEVELKGYAAIATHKKLWTDGVKLDKVAAGLLLNVNPNWYHPEIIQLIAGAIPATWETRPLSSTPTQEWLKRQVLPTLVQDGLKIGYPLLLDWLYELTWERLKTSLPPDNLTADPE